MKRFYREATVGEGNRILLDGRPVRTPGRVPLALPNARLAEAIAEEWNVQGERIDPRAMRLTGLANAAIDRIAPDPAAFAQGLAAYGESDLPITAPKAAPLVAREAACGTDTAWARARYDIASRSSGHHPQVAREDRLARRRFATRGRSAAGLSPWSTSRARDRRAGDKKGLGLDADWAAARSTSNGRPRIGARRRRGGAPPPDATISKPRRGLSSLDPRRRASGRTSAEWDRYRLELLSRSHH